MIYTDFENMEIEKYTEPPSSRILVPNLFDTGPVLWKMIFPRNGGVGGGGDRGWFRL